MQGRTGIPLSAKSRKKLSEKLKGHSVSSTTRKRIGLSGLGRTPWNKGLDKTKDNRLLNVSRKVSKFNSNMSEQTKRKISQTLKKNYLKGMPIPNSKVGYRNDLQMSFRSRWEANFARVLKLRDTEVFYETDRFPLLDEDGQLLSVYIPDFKIDEEAFVEIKGHADSKSRWTCNCKRCIRDKDKLEAFKRSFPHIKLHIIGKEEYRDLSKKYAHLIPEWES